MIINKAINSREKGQKGEKLAVKYLKKSGYKILENNYYTLHGEIDIIAENEADLVFIEVKTRNSGSFGTAAEAVDKYKQNKIIKSALVYLKLKNLLNISIRFDVLCMGSKGKDIELIKAAFDASEQYIY